MKYNIRLDNLEETTGKLAVYLKHLHEIPAKPRTILSDENMYVLVSIGKFKIIRH